MMTTALAPAHDVRSLVGDAVIAMSERLDESATRVTDAIHEACPELPQDLYRATRQSTRANIGLITTMIAAGADAVAFAAPEEALAYVRGFVHEGLSFDLLTRAYRVGEHAYKGIWREELHERTRATGSFAGAIGYIDDWVFSYIGAVTTQLGVAFSGEHEQWSRGSVAVRSEEVRAILSGAGVDIVEASSRIGYRLERRHLAFVIFNADAGQSGRLSRGASVINEMKSLADEVAATLGVTSYLALPMAGYYAGWAALSADADVNLDALSTRRPGLRFAFGRPAKGVEGFRRSHHEALLARRVAEMSDRSPATMGFHAVALDALLTHDGHEAQRFVVDELGPLLDGSPGNERLLQTLEVYLEEESSYVRAGRRLGIHENTAAYRVHRAEQALGRRTSERQMELRAALRLAHLCPGAA